MTSAGSSQSESGIPGYDPAATAGNCWFDEEAAGKAVEFFPRFLKHSKGKMAGEPFELDVWQIAIISNLFGWKRPDGTRRYRQAFIEVPRKAGKSTMCAGIALYMLLVDGEPGAEVYGCASSRDQASIVFEIAKTMVLRDEVLRDVCKPYRKAITIESTGSSYKVISADADHQHGANASAVIFDELHAMPNRELYDVMTTSTGARQQPLVISITTSGWDRQSIAYLMHDYAGKVRDGIIDDPAFMPVIYGLQEGEDWKDEETWLRVHPGIGTTVELDYFRRECQKAQNQPSYENTFRRLLLCEWTSQESRWMNMASWDACLGKFDAESLEGRPCVAGIDLSSTRDLSAMVLMFEGDESETLIMPWFWIPEEQAEMREKRDRVPYLSWVKQGFINATEGNVVDYDVIRRDINELAERYEIQGIAMDRFNATQLATQLQGDGMEVMFHGQGFRAMSGPTKHVEKLILGKGLVHDGNPVLRWCFSNVQVETNAHDDIRASKKKSYEKIDGVIALVMAAGYLLNAEGEEGTDGTIYDERGIITL